MKFLCKKTVVASVFGVAALMGCGGGGGSSAQVPVATNPAPATSIAAIEVVQYMDEMRASGSESTEPRDISLIDMAADDTGEPGAV